jgi:hypothetical protein
VILENGQVAAQGDWRTLESQSSELQKFSFGNEDDSPAGPADKATISSKQTEDDAEKDLHRRVGDRTLYSTQYTIVVRWQC